MKEETKEILIEKMLDRPETLTEDEIKSIVNDQELRTFYETSVEIKNSLMKPQKIDKKLQWRRLVKRLLKFDKWSVKNIFRAAAIIIGAIFIGEVTSNNDNNLDFNF